MHALSPSKGRVESNFNSIRIEITLQPIDIGICTAPLMKDLKIICYEPPYQHYGSVFNVKSEEKKRAHFKNWPFIKNPQFLSYLHETW